MTKFGFIILFLFVKFVVWLCRNIEPLQPPQYKRDSNHHVRRTSIRPPTRQTQTFTHHDRDVERIAKRLKAEIGSSTQSSFRFASHRHQYEAFVERHHGAHVIRLVGHWPESGFRMLVLTDRKKGKTRRTLNMEDVEIGNRRFDKDFILQTDSVHTLKKVLTKQVCNRIRKHAKRAHGRISINVAGNVIEFGGVATRILKVEQVVAIIKSFTAIHRLMLDAFASSEHEPLDAELTFIDLSQATCMVCGNPMDESRVKCTKCLTPHHRDCWDYIGRCSTYGCTSRKAN